MISSATKIIVVDDHQLFIDGLKAMMYREDNISIVGEALNGQILLNKLKKEVPDVVLMDIDMPVLNGFEASKIIKRQYPEVKILILSMNQEKKQITELIKIGIDGYASKNLGAQELKSAIKKILGGEAYYDKFTTELIINSYKKRPQSNSKVLTNREKEVTALISDGLNSNEIANKLFLSPHTVEAHRKNIFSKLGVKNIANLVRYALQSGLVS